MTVFIIMIFPAIVNPNAKNLLNIYRETVKFMEGVLKSLLKISAFAII